MNFLKRFSIVLFISFLLFLIIINIFKPIIFAQELIFPYAITKFDIVSRFPTVWFYIKLLFCISCFFNLFLATNSILKFILIKNKIKGNKIKENKIIKNNNYFNSGNFNLLIGTNSINQNKIYIPEKGLYQNIFITGTIGSRKNRFLHVSIFTTIN